VDEVVFFMDEWLKLYEPIHYMKPEEMKGYLAEMVKEKLQPKIVALTEMLVSWRKRNDKGKGRLLIEHSTALGAPLLPALHQARQEGAVPVLHPAPGVLPLHWLAQHKRGVLLLAEGGGRGGNAAPASSPGSAAHAPPSRPPPSRPGALHLWLAGGQQAHVR